MTAKTSRCGRRRGDRVKKPLYLPGLDPERYRVKKIAIGIPEDLVSQTKRDECRQYFDPAHEYDQAESPLIGGDGKKVLVCESFQPSSFEGGTVRTTQWTSLPITLNKLSLCWLMILAHRSANLCFQNCPKRVSSSRRGEGKKFAWISVRMAHITRGQAASTVMTRIVAENAHPKLEPWMVEFDFRSSIGQQSSAITMSARQCETSTRTAA